jgi:hypothetical protein
MALLAAAWAAWAAWTSKQPSLHRRNQKAPQRCGAFLLCRASRAVECRLQRGAVGFAPLFLGELFELACFAGFFNQEVFASRHLSLYLIAERRNDLLARTWHRVSGDHSVKSYCLGSSTELVVIHQIARPCLGEVISDGISDAYLDYRGLFIPLPWHRN